MLEKTKNNKKEGRKVLFGIIINAMNAVAPRAPETVGEANRAAITVINRLCVKYRVSYSKNKQAIIITTKTADEKGLRSTGDRKKPTVTDRITRLDK